MEANEAFELIDKRIASFIVGKKCWLSNDNHSDWLVFYYRAIKWKRSGINLSIEIFPNFDKNENILSWSIRGNAWYDKRKERYMLSRLFAHNISLTDMANNIIILLQQAYKFIQGLEKFDIPKLIITSDNLTTSSQSKHSFPSPHKGHN
jgi:hypothetical protein